jgi:hypothetical protein
MIAYLRETQPSRSMIVQAKAQIDRGVSVISMCFVDFLNDLPASHIQGTDEKYVPFLLEKGVG